MNIAIRQTDHTLIVVVAGDWELEHPVPRFDRLVEDRPEGDVVQVVGFDTTELGTWDSSLLTFLSQGMNYCEAHDLAFEAEGLPEDIARLLELARAVPEQEIDHEEEPPSLVTRVGQKGLSAFDSFMASVSFVGEVTAGLIGLLLFRVRMRWRDFWVVVQSNSSGALLIVTLISFLVGLIIAFLGAVVLRRFGAGYYVSYLVGYGMLREMGALMTGIIMAGRTGAAFAAELGSMKITEEIDAFKTLGLSPVEHLVLPRVLGLFLMLPLLTIYADFIGIMGGMIVSIALLDLSATQFVGGLLTPVTLSDGLLGVFKGSVFGLIIGLSGCLRGLQTGDDAGAVGRAATSAVVTAITLIILANAVIDWLAVILEV
jgi:phospholipid/cholesterol/gamma-HCH transport system permease protein